MSRVKIYALLNPISSSIVYVGATAKELSYRLSQHLWVFRNRKDSGDEKMNERVRLFQYLQIQGKTFSIILLEECDFGLSNDREFYYFNLHKDTVLQRGIGNFIKQKRNPIPKSVLKKRARLNALGYKHPGSISNLLKNKP